MQFRINHRSSPAILSFFLAIAFSSVGLADNWPHWRGDHGNGVSLTAKPPTEWSSTKNVTWKVPIPGRGSGSPVVWEDRVFVVTAVGGQRQTPRTTLEFKLLCFDRSKGTLLWEQTATSAKPHQETHDTNGFASASPCTDGERVYAHFGSRGLYCYTLDGNLVWQRDDLGRMKTRNNFGEGSSPTLVDDKIIVPWDHEGPSYITSLDKLTGKTIWKVARDEPTCWATPLIVEHNAKKQIIMNGQNYARAYDLETGAELWRCGGQTDRPVASAVTNGDLVFIGSGYRGSFLGAFRLGGSGDISKTANVAWSISQDTPDIASPLLSNGRIYFHKGKNGIISCFDAKSGTAHYKSQRLPKLKTIYASPIAAGGNVYFTDRNGTTVVVKEDDQLKIVATNSLGETVDATPAPAGDQLFIRGEKHLFCISE